MFPATDVPGKVRMFDRVHYVFFFGSRKQKALGAWWSEVVKAYALVENDTLRIEVADGSDSRLELHMWLQRDADLEDFNEKEKARKGKGRKKIRRSAHEQNNEEQNEPIRMLEMRKTRLWKEAFNMEDSDEDQDNAIGIAEMSDRGAHTDVNVNNEDEQNESTAIRGTSEAIGMTKRGRRRGRTDISVDNEDNGEGQSEPRRVTKRKKRQRGTTSESNGEEGTGQKGRCKRKKQQESRRNDEERQKGTNKPKKDDEDDAARTMADR